MRLFFNITILIILTCISNIFAIDSTQIIFHFHGEDASSRIGSRVKGIGDINNDGFDDIAFTSLSPLGTYIFLGGNPVDTIPDMFIRGPHTISDLGDYTGDGINDVLTSDVNEHKVFLYRGFTDSLESAPSDSIAPDSFVFAFGGTAGGYVNSDNIMDLLVRDNNTPGGGSIYYYENPFTDNKDKDWTYSITDYSTTIRLFGYGFIDYNGDNILDIYLGLRKGQTGSPGFLYFFYGPNFSDTADLVINLSNDSIGIANNGLDVFNIGDVNGDSLEDLGVVFNSRVLLFFGGGSDSYDLILPFSPDNVVGVKDVNGDSKDDLVMGAGRSNNGELDIYLGGDIIDTTIDLTVYRSDLPPLFLDKIGWRLDSAGDFDGDGYNDIIFSCQNFAGGEPRDVFILAGSPNIVTDVEYEYEPNLPDNFELKQNYPNPFNPSTTIEFQVSHREHITLSIYNTLGQKIRTLIDKELSVGSYSVVWDGKNRGGDKVSSGVYLYKLETAENVISKKMILLK